MAVCTVIFMSFLDLRLYKHFFSLVFHILLVLLQLLLTNLQNVLKFEISPTKTKDHQLTKMVI